MQIDALTGDVGEGFDEYIFYLLYQVTNRRNRDFAEPLGALGLTPPQWRAMSTINRLDGCLMGELAEFTTVDRTTLTRTVDQLVKSGWVLRSAAVGDRRQVVVSLTDEGRAVFHRAVEALRRHNARLLDGVSGEDMRGVRVALQKVLKNIAGADEALFRQLLHFSR
jgi:DNA-binding MarR family transcriptional regulator